MNSVQERQPAAPAHCPRQIRLVLAANRGLVDRSLSTVIPFQATGGPSMGQLVQTLKERGHRLTPQRQLILEAIESADGHASAESVHAKVAAQFPQVNISTVYRTLELLQNLGLVTHTHFDDGIALYHLTEDSHHQHMVCRLCGSEREIDVDELWPLDRHLRERYGFQADLAHFAIIGTCAACVADGEADP
jgi:Fur family transcriptional regulator, ferric uptake regulator